MKEKVIVKIKKGKYSPSVKNGAEYISVGFSAKSYGAGSPCDNEKEMHEAIKHQSDWITKEGDIPIVKDLRFSGKQKTL